METNFLFLTFEIILNYSLIIDIWNLLEITMCVMSQDLINFQCLWTKYDVILISNTLNYLWFPLLKFHKPQFRNSNIEIETLQRIIKLTCLWSPLSSHNNSNPSDNLSRTDYMAY